MFTERRHDQLHWAEAYEIIRWHSDLAENTSDEGSGSLFIVGQGSFSLLSKIPSLGDFPFRRIWTEYVGELLEGSHVQRCGYIKSGATTFVPLHDCWLELGQTHVGATLSPSLMPPSPEERTEVFETLISSLESITDVEVLDKWMNLIVDREFEDFSGGLPDSAAVAIFGRLLQLDEDTSAKWLDRFLSEADALPFRPGHFQISILGTVAQAASENVLSQIIVERLQGEITSMVASNLPKISEATTASAAVESVILLLQAEDSPEAALRILNHVAKLLDVITKEHDKKFFLQFLSDSLGHFIGAENLQKHWLKLLVLSKFLRKESVLWPESGIVSLLQAVFVEPAQTALAAVK